MAGAGATGIRAGGWPSWGVSAARVHYRICLEFVQIDWQTGAFHLFRKRVLPSSGGVLLEEEYAAVVGWHFNRGAVNGRHPGPPEPAQEEAKLEDYVLPRPVAILVWRVRRQAAFVIRTKEDDRESNLRVVQKLLDDGSSFVWLFVEDYGLEPQPVDEACNGRLETVIPAVDDEHLFCVRRFRESRAICFMGQRDQGLRAEERFESSLH